MTEIPLSEADPVAGVSFAGFRAAVEPISQYLQAPDPALLIRSGLVEEVCEVLDAESEDVSVQAKEAGDCAYYCNAVAGLRDTTLETLTGCESFGAWQALVETSPPESLPVYDAEMRLQADLRPQDDLAIRMLRLVDAMNPRQETAAVWYGYTERPTVEYAVVDAFAALARYASARGISLDDGVQQMLDKVLNRQRQPHVVAEMDVRLQSDRDQLAQQSPLVVSLLLQTVQGGGVAPYGFDNPLR